MEYTAVIRTLGKAGEKYRCLLDSLVNQTIKPSRILVYIAEGYAIPKETIGWEEYIYVKKGMVAQRALEYNEVSTKYILFLDDDVYLPRKGVETMFDALITYNADVISPDVFHNSERPIHNRIIMTLSGRMRSRKDDRKWAYKVMRTAGYSYNVHPSKDVYLSQTNAGACFFCSKNAFLSVNFRDEVWLDRQEYALGEDQIMFYKMHLNGLKQLTIFNSGIEHLDAGLNRKPEKEKSMIKADFFFKTIFWHRFIYSPEKAPIMRIYDCICIGYAFCFSIISSIVKCRFDILKIKYSAIKDGITFIKSEEYRNLPII